MAKISTMNYLTFNILMTLIGMTRKAVIDEEVSKYIKFDPENIMPEYPKDLTNFAKPSIIIEEITTYMSSLFGKGFIGQTWDEDYGGYVDVNSRIWNCGYDFYIVADTNTQYTMLSSVITDVVFADSEFVIYDFAKKTVNPDAVTRAQIIKDIANIPWNANKNMDYRRGIRIYFELVQTIVPQPGGDMIDIDRLKIAQHVIV
jgi:hypothetical protein